MKAKALTLAAFLVISISLAAQENEKKEKMKYSNVTEFGFTTASPKGISFEATTAHGFSVEKQHHFGLGTGIGINLHITTNTHPWGTYSSLLGTIYMPIFFNYRYCFKPEKPFSPHINIALGGITSDNMGVYSVIAMGFKSGAFSFSSGLSFMPFVVTEYYYDYYYDEWGIYQSNTKSESKWLYPFGLTLKVGFTF